MGLKKEIEQIFQKALDVDLERISRSAEPSYHWTSSPPVSMFMRQSPAVHTGSVVVCLAPQDYQVRRIELNPFRIDPLEMKENLTKIKERRKERNVARTAFETNVEDGSDEKYSVEKRSDHLHEAYHEYIEESGARNPIPILPRCCIINEKEEVEEPIISVAGVDYVLTDYLESPEKYSQIKDKLHNTPLATIDQWPEEIALRQPGGTLEYVRADVHFYDESGQEQDKRLAP